MRNYGWLKAHRCLLGSDVWECPDAVVRVWVWALLKATHKPRNVEINGQIVHLEAGQFVFGRRGAAKECRLSEQAMRTCLATLARLECIAIAPTHRFSTLTVKNWEKYQDSQGAADAANPLLHQPTDQPTETPEINPLISAPGDSKKGENKGSGEDDQPTETAPIPPQINHRQEVVKKYKHTGGGGNGDGKRLTADEHRKRDADALVVLYGERVKPPRDDSSRTQARRNAARLLREGRSREDLERAVCNYGEWADAKGRPAEMRKNCGNFFGREVVFQDFMPGVYEPATPQRRPPPDRADAILAGVVAERGESNANNRAW
ncbi:MAG TPA: hypothetical protein VMW52_13825 [Phycisphaerae bacterium]|nr:hypothetical protein [Phycisphaerae bacterium]